MEKIASRSLPKEAQGLIILFVTILVSLALISFNTSNSETNWLGIFGHAIAFLFSYSFGLLSYGLIAIAFHLGWKLLTTGSSPLSKLKLLYLLFLGVSFGILLNCLSEIGMPAPKALQHKIIHEEIEIPLPYPHLLIRNNLGGVPLYYLYRDIPAINLDSVLTTVGVLITFSLSSILFFILAFDINLLELVRRRKAETPPMPIHAIQMEKNLSQSLSSPQPMAPPLRIRTIQEKETLTPLAAPKKGKKIDPLSGYQLPSITLLQEPEKMDQPLLKKELKKQAEILEETLLSFGIEAKVGDINCGPSIISFEVHPSVGVKVQKITTLENDLALKLQAKSIRIIAPIPGKAAVGIEIPSPHPHPVSFKEMLSYYQASAKKMAIPILLGKTVTGDNVITDLTKMPHCLIAGATGSGKSVCINTIIMSIIMNASPDDVKLLMVDPKKVELTAYGELPHMLAPVITEPQGAYAALSFLVKEMQSRYDLLKQLACRNISAFNEREINKEFEASLNITVPEKLPFIVAIIDEFADLMMASSTDLETPIARIAQMARAVGIHLILATQRPSREVVTGLIKANFPTRIAFKVASRVNSQIILDNNGAEALLGNGDMLFLPPASPHLMRAQGAYISDSEINCVIDFVCKQSPPKYQIASFDELAKEMNESGPTGNGKDALYDQALTLVLQTKNASTTFLQRKLKIGYARAASLIDELESNGVISSQEGSKPRKILQDSFRFDNLDS